MNFCLHREIDEKLTLNNMFFLFVFSKICTT